MIRHFSELEAGQVARRLVLEVYRASNSFPPEEVYGMRRQIRNAATSIAANIAEGFGRYHHKDNLRFLYNARGSLAEVESFIMLSEDLRYLDESTVRQLRALCQDQLRVLNGYIKSVRARTRGDAELPCQRRDAGFPITKS